MKRIITTAYILLVTAATVQGRDIRINVNPELSTQPSIFWYQAEQVFFTATFTTNVPGLYDPGAEVYWDITDPSGAPVHLSIPCVITSNAVTATLAPTNSNLTPATYAGYLRLENGETNGVLSRQRINVYWSSAGGTYPIVGPLALQVPTTGVYRASLTHSNADAVAITGDELTITLNTNNSVDWSQLTPEASNAIAAASGSTGSGGTTLQKSGITLNGTYILGNGITVNGSTIDVAAVDSGTTILGTPQHGQLIAYQSTPYDAPVYVSGTPTVGDGVWFDGTNWYYGPQSYSQQHDYGITIGSGLAVYEFSGVTNTFVVPLGVSNLLVKLWGSAGANGSYASRAGPGGYASGYLTVVAGESLRIVVGGGIDFGNKTGAFGGGGNAGVHSVAGAGGGGSYVLRDGNLLAATGGGAGGSGPYYGGGGGGLVGSDGVGTYPGGGGTQTAGGSGQRPGSFMAGGNGFQGSGGGGGYYGGGGGGDHSNSTGGGGSSYIALLRYAVTYASNFSLDADYIAGVGEPSAAPYSHGGPGLVVIRW